MGSRLNEAEDSRPFIEFYDAWGPACLEAGGGFPDDHRKSAQSTFLECLALARHLADLPRPDAPWGVKVPRNLLFTRLWMNSSRISGSSMSSDTVWTWLTRAIRINFVCMGTWS